MKDKRAPRSRVAAVLISVEGLRTQLSWEGIVLLRNHRNVWWGWRRTIIWPRQKFEAREEIMELMDANQLSACSTYLTAVPSESSSHSNAGLFVASGSMRWQRQSRSVSTWNATQCAFLYSPFYSSDEADCSFNPHPCVLKPNYQSLKSQARVRSSE